MDTIMGVPDFAQNIGKALKHLRGNDGECVYLFILHQSASGDLPHLIPVLRNPQIRVLVMGGPGAKELDATTGKLNLGEVLVSEFGVPGNQVARAVSMSKAKEPKNAASSVSDVKQEINRLKLNFAGVCALSDSTKIIRWQFFNQGEEQVFGAEGKAPKLLGNDINGPTLFDTRHLKESLYASHINGLTDNDQGLFDKIIKSSDLQFDRSLVVLWGRRASKDGGAHYDANHSNTGWSQLAAKCVELGFNVVLTGQYKEDPRKKHLGLAKCFFLGEFYKEPYMSRPKQLCFFDEIGARLGKSKHKYLHVGMRSGGLDFLGLAGQPMLYIAYEKLVADFQTGEPKLKFDERIKGLTEAASEVGTELSINRASISRQPKRWTTTDGINYMKDDARKAEGNDAKGFLDADLKKIVGSITSLLA